MSNFAFIRTSLPAVHAECVRAESYLSSDPAAACFYSRRAIEQLVGHLYDVIGLPEPYQSDLSARINDAAFKSKVGVAITGEAQPDSQGRQRRRPRRQADPAAHRPAGSRGLRQDLNPDILWAGIPVGLKHAAPSPAVTR